MVIAICTCSRAEYEEIAGWTVEYGEENGESITTRWFQTREEYVWCCKKEQFQVTVLSFDDIVNQELAVTIGSAPGTSKIIWIGEDGRFGVSSYRVRAANFLLKPVQKMEIWDSLDRCLKKHSARWLKPDERHHG